MLDIFLQSEHIRHLQTALQEGKTILIEELWNSPKALVSTLAQNATGKHVLILTGGSLEESRLYQDLAFFSQNPLIDFPAWETLPAENIAPSPDIVGERYQALQKLSTTKQPHIVLSSLQACLQKLIPPSRFQKLYLELKKGDLHDFNELIAQLEKMGYQKHPIASDKGQFAVRGGIIDIFPVASPDPFRLEFWDIELESLRVFDPIGQKSIRQVESISITPAQELELIGGNEELCTILDFLGPNTLVIFDDLVALEDRYASLMNMSGHVSRSFTTIEEFLKLLDPLQKIYLTQQPIRELSEINSQKKIGRSYYSNNIPVYELNFEMFDRKLSAYQWNNPFLTVSEYLFPQDQDEERTGQELIEALAKQDHKNVHLDIIAASELDETSFVRRLKDGHLTLPTHTHYQYGYLSSGFVLEDIHRILFPLTEVTKRYKIRRQKLRSTYHTTPIETYELSAGDMVVHYNNGIGRYLGMEKRKNSNGIDSEFFVVEYAENAKLFVPINQAHMVSKYIGSQDELPKMHTLGNNRWKNTRDKAERAIAGYAKDLLELYAQRQQSGNKGCQPDSPDMQAFEEDFAYVETEDQLDAINKVKEDMVSDKPMDRLVCGDVGYGKTEVAMRAAFKGSVDGNKQVAVLVPTTVLAMQHYENFVDRFANFPLNIGVLSRFRSSKQIQETLKGIEEGSVDIVIGTHRIISQDVKFKNLGLIIIDEEQRFGVRAKEHLKKIKVDVDCLTLSATPIPRTLYMSLIGARDLSTINTPPQDRLPISTMITDGHEQVLRNALLRELARDGQIYVIHNRVETIFEYAAKIQKLVPQARIVVGHGQMSSNELDTVFHAFKKGDADILVATTIVENGIDIPNANTIIIDRADRFGIADLYQLRGRVGRWNRRAYAYFIVPKVHTLPEIVRKRLEALAMSSGYGGGMKVAMRDLELRGAGNILGMEQSGHVSSIGFHLYCKLLKRTMQALQGKIPKAISDTRVEVACDARLPEDYVNEPSLRMEFYQRFGDAITLEEVEEIWTEIQDRFGPAPEPAKWLYHLTRVRAKASQIGYTLVKLDQFVLILEKNEGKGSSVKKIPMAKPKTPELLEKVILENLVL